jgi:hypothetical protein
MLLLTKDRNARGVRRRPVKEIRDRLAELDRLQRDIEYRMAALPERFTQSVPRARLRLRAWRRQKGGPPYAVYWIIMNRRRIPEFRWERDKPTFPFRRRKIRTRQDLDDAIFLGMACNARRTVYRYHAEVRALNAAHASIARAVEAIRKRLHPYREFAPDEPADLHLWHGLDFRRVRRLLHGFESHLDSVQVDLQRLDLDMSILPILPFRLVYEQDLDHPYGRLRWRRIRDGRMMPPLTDRLKRELRLDPEIRRRITPYEVQRRRTMRRLTAATSVLRSIQTPLPWLLPKALTLLRNGGIDIPIESFWKGAAV